MKKSQSLVIVGLLLLSVSCTSINKSIKDGNASVRFTKSDFTLSDQVSAVASSTTILGIDFSRIFMRKTGQFGTGDAISASIVPIVGNLVTDHTSSYAVHNLLDQNQGYDVVFYPQYEKKIIKPILGLGFLTKITTVKVSARLAKLKN